MTVSTKNSQYMLLKRAAQKCSWNWNPTRSLGRIWRFLFVGFIEMGVLFVC